MLSLSSLKIAELALKRAQETVITDSELIKAGRLVAVDLVQSETSVANKKLSLRNAQNTADTDRYRLGKVMQSLPVGVQGGLTVKGITNTTVGIQACNACP